jgi:glucose-6-phosphate 1-dehydrogenase
MENLDSDAFVFFGATGDLAYEQIFPALQAIIQRGHFDMPIIGVARSAKDLDGLRARARESIEKHGSLDPRAFAALLAKLQYVNGDYASPETFRQLRKALGAAFHPLYYLAIPPGLFATVAEGLAHAECDKGARLVVEKPFGRDLSSAQALNRTLHKSFPELAIFRIDRHLIKEHCSAGISIRAYSLWFLAALFFLAYAGMIGDIVFIAAQVLNLAAICAIVIYAKRYENKLCIMHRNLLLDS